MMTIKNWLVDYGSILPDITVGPNVDVVGLTVRAQMFLHFRRDLVLAHEKINLYGKNKDG